MEEASLARRAVAEFVGTAFLTLCIIGSGITFAGIAPASVPMFVLAELVGALLGLGVVTLLYPRRRAETR